MEHSCLRPRHILIAFGFGAIATLVASWASLALMLRSQTYTFPFDAGDGSLLMVLMAIIVAPFVEELAKPIGLYFIGSEEKPEFTLAEWAGLGAAAGLGFAVVENFLYAATVLSYGTDVSLWLLGLRFLLPLHMLATAISGFGLGLWHRTGKAKYFAACIAVSMLLHGFYNLAATAVG